MTSQEKELLTRFLQQLATAQAGQKDTEAEPLIKEAVGRQPDAAYLLVQRAIQLEELLQASQAEVQKLQARVSQAGSGSRGGFLSDPNAWGKEGAPRVQPAAAQRPAGGAAAARAPAGSWGSGLFGNIAATAAGVVAGSFLFQGIQGLMHRDDTDLPAVDHQNDQAQASEPELLNSYDTPADFADSGDLGGMGDIG